MIYFLFVIIGYEHFSISVFLNRITIVKNINSGFTSSFIVFFLTIPFLNILLHNLSEKMHLRLILLCSFLYVFLSSLSYFDFGVTMNYVLWFIVIYFIASYVRLYPRKVFDKTRIRAVAAIICIILSAISVLGSLRFIWRDPYYFIADSNKILAVITAFCLFMFFKTVYIPYSRFINIVASATFGVLFIHANSDTMKQQLWKDTLQNAVVFNTQRCYLHSVCSVLGIYILCAHALTCLGFIYWKNRFIGFMIEFLQKCILRCISLRAKYWVNSILNKWVIV